MFVSFNRDVQILKSSLLCYRSYGQKCNERTYSFLTSPKVMKLYNGKHSVFFYHLHYEGCVLSLKALMSIDKKDNYDYRIDGIQFSTNKNPVFVCKLQNDMSVNYEI